MKVILDLARHVVVVAVLGCIVMFAAVTIYGAVAVGQAVVQMVTGGVALSDVATATVYAFKVLDLFLVGTILYIVALGLGALFLGTGGALPGWFEVREILDLKVVVSQSVIVVMLVAFLGDVLKWEQASDVAFVGAGIALVTSAVAFSLRHPPHGRRHEEEGADG